MDKHGYFNFGTSVSFTPNFCDAAKIVIAEVNSTVPICLGGNRESIHISEIDYIVEGDNQPMIQLPEVPVTDIDKKIAAIVMEEIEDGACLQLGNRRNAQRSRGYDSSVGFKGPGCTHGNDVRLLCRYV